MFRKILMAALGATVLVAMPQAGEARDVIAKLKETKVINLGHRETSVPFAFLGDDNKPIGYTMDLCMKIVERFKKEFEIPDLKIKYIPVTSQTRIPLMANGQIDIECGSTTNNLTRQKQVDYLNVTFITGTKLVVRKGEGIKGIADLSGKAIALALGTTNEKAVKKIAEAQKIDIDYTMVKDHSQGWLAFETGRVDAYATDHAVLFGLISKAKEPQKYEVVGKFLSYDPYGIMVPRGNSEYRRVANAELADLMRSGEIIEIYKKWFTGPGSPNMPLEPLMEAAYIIGALPY